MKRKHGSQLVRIRYQVADQVSTPAQSSSSASGQPPEVHSTSQHLGSAVSPHLLAKVTPDAMFHERQPAPRTDAPVILHSARGSKEHALRSVDSVQAQQEALHLLEKDTEARSSVGPRDSLLRSWVSFPFTSCGGVPAYSSEEKRSWSSVNVRWLPLASKLFHKDQGGAYQVRLSMVPYASASGEKRNDKRHSRRAVCTARSRDGLAGRVPVGVSRMRLTPWRQVAGRLRSILLHARD